MNSQEDRKRRKETRRKAIMNYSWPVLVKLQTPRAKKHSYRQPKKKHRLWTKRYQCWFFLWQQWKSDIASYKLRDSFHGERQRYFQIKQKNWLWVFTTSKSILMKKKMILHDDLRWNLMFCPWLEVFCQTVQEIFPHQHWWGLFFGVHLLAHQQRKVIF